MGFQRSILPLVNVNDDLVGYLGNQLRADVGTIDFMKMCLNVPSGHSLGIETDNLPIEPFKTPAVLRDDPGKETTSSITRQGDGDLA